MVSFCHGTYVVGFSLPGPSLPYRRRIVDLFERLTALMSVSQNLEREKKREIETEEEKK